MNDSQSVGAGALHSAEGQERRSGVPSEQRPEEDSEPCILGGNVPE